MANDEHLALLRQGVATWNAWREQPQNLDRRVDLSGMDLSGADLFEAKLWNADLREAKLVEAYLCKVSFWQADLSGADLFRAHLEKADLGQAGLRGANLSEAGLRGANLSLARLVETDLFRAHLGEADLSGADLSKANLRGARLGEADLENADLRGADLRMANLAGANLLRANLSEADLRGANLSEANLLGARLVKADLKGASLINARLVATDLTNADLIGCRVYGISAWDVKLDGAKQRDLVITKNYQPEITVDNIEVGQFIYLLLHNEKIRNVIDTIGKKGVLLLGRFSGGRIAVLEQLRAELRKRDFVPIVFNFERPEKSDFTETVMTLTGLCRFVIVDITNPRSAPLELKATVPEYMIPFVPIIEVGEEPFAMFRDLWVKHSDWVLDPIAYGSVEELVQWLDEEIIKPALARFDELLVKKTKELQIRRIGT